MKDIVILGAGGLAREVAFLIETINRHSPEWRILGFVERDEQLVGKVIGRYSVFCSEQQLRGMSVHAAIGIGDPAVRAGIADRFADTALVFPNLVDPGTIWDAERISLGEGNIITAGNIFTTDISIGSFNYFNLAVTYGHDVVIEDHCVINPGATISGGVRIGSRVLVGSGATILQYLAIGAGATIGAGAVVTREVAPGSTVVGVPARPVGSPK